MTNVVVRHRVQPTLTCSCGNVIPFIATARCPHCGVRPERPSAPRPGPDSTVIDGDAPGVVLDADTGKVVAVQALTAVDVADTLAAQLATVKWTAAPRARLSGIVNDSVHVGNLPPVPMKRRYACGRCALNRSRPDIFATIGAVAGRMEATFNEYAPEAWADTMERVDAIISPAWRLAGTPWTSGIINRTATLPYHYDRNNVSRSWSGMIAARAHVDGGMLHLADYDVYLTIPHGSITLFDGQSILHGVTPFDIRRRTGYRYTAVLYALNNMKTCAPDPRDEARRAALAADAAAERKATHA